MHRKTFIDFDICQQMTLLWKLYLMTLTSFFKVKKWNVSISETEQNWEWLQIPDILTVLFSKMQTITKQNVFAELPPLLWHLPLSCSCCICKHLWHVLAQPVAPPNSNWRQSSSLINCSVVPLTNENASNNIGTTRPASESMQRVNISPDLENVPSKF